MRETDEFIFFWGGESPFSNHYPAPFVYNGIQFAHTEQFMMFLKAYYFSDDKMVREILAETDPKKNKKQGRAVNNFNDNLWVLKARDWFFPGLIEKFLQNPDILRDLLKTKGKLLVEASLYDTRWGIGMDMNHSTVLDPSTWHGENWLGLDLSSAREHIFQIYPYFSPELREIVENIIMEENLV